MEHVPQLVNYALQASYKQILILIKIKNTAKV